MTDHAELIAEARAYVSQDESHMFLVERLTDALEKSEARYRCLLNENYGEHGAKLLESAMANEAEIKRLKEQIKNLNDNYVPAYPGD